jgi:hypothetical protein
MTEIKILFPPENHILYGDSLNFRYDIKNTTKDNAKTLVIVLDGTEYSIDIGQYKTKYTFTELKTGNHSLTGYLKTSTGKTIPNTDFTINFKAVTEKFTPPNLNWISIKEKLPLFIREDYKTFTKFVEVYYEWLQTSNNPVYSIFNSETFSDIEKTPEIFLESFRTQYLNDFPTNVLEINDQLNIRKVIKNIRQFYSSKGTEKSFKFLFRLLYNAYVEIYYPRKDLLVASGDLWIEKKSIRIRGINWNQANKIKKSVIYQRDAESNIISSARILSVNSFKIDTEEIFELTIDNIVGKFDLYTPEQSLVDYTEGYIGEKVYVDVLDNGEVIPHEVYMINGITSINVTTTGLTIGQYLTVLPNSPSTGKGFSAVVKTVDERGIPTSISIINHGYDYRGKENTFIIYRKESDNTLTALSGTITIAKLMYETGYYETIASAPSSTGVIRDNRKYQEMSYVIKSIYAGRPEVYLDAVKKLIHPAGVAVFHDTLHKRNTSIPPQNLSLVNRYTKPYIGNYLPYTFNTTKNLREDSYPNGNPVIYYNGLTDLYPNGVDFGSPLPNETTATLEHLPRPQQQIANSVKYTQFTFIPPVSDSGFVNEYWVVYPHPNTSLNVLNKNVPIKDLFIKDFITLFTETINFQQ